MFLSLHRQRLNQTHKHRETCTYRSEWSLLIMQGVPHGRQMACLIFQTDTGFWYLIWWLLCVSVCMRVCIYVWFPRMNSINLSSEGPCWLIRVCVCLCASIHSVFCCVEVILQLRSECVCTLVIMKLTLIADQWLTRAVMTSRYSWTLSCLCLGHISVVLQHPEFKNEIMWTFILSFFELYILENEERERVALKIDHFDLKFRS